MAAADLPPQLTSFIGRTNELVEIAALLADPTCRLLTLVGPGGIGKTRLALQTAADAQSHFADGACFVALQPVSSTAFLVQAFADALHLTFYGPEVPRLQLLRWLRPQKLLIVVDNFEHLLDDVALLTEIVEAAPGVKLLVTSRETLNVREEWVREIGGMRVPRDDQSGELDSYDAVQLFAARARQARGDFALERERPHVVRICQLVEGLPLAIELAAARIRTLSCAQIAEEIRHSMGFLTTSLRNVPARHRDMYAVFGPCWNRLTQPQRDVFMRLSVFRGGFECEAAEQVAGASPPMLATLTDKSLLRVTQTGRYEIHELVRQYAAARLEETAAEGDRARDRHCDYYAAFLAQRERDLKGAELLRALAEIRPEIDNIRVMWRWAVARGRWDAVAECLDSLGFIFQNRAMWHEAADTFGMATNALGDEPSVLLGRLLLWQGHIGASVYGAQKTFQLLRKAVTVLREFGLYHADPMSFQFLPFCWEDPGDIERLELDLLDILARFREQCDSWGAANTLVWLGVISENRDDVEQSEARMAESLALYRKIGNLWGMSSAVQGMNEATFRQGKYEEARQYAEECITLCEAIDDQPGIAHGLSRLGRTHYALGDYRKARELLEENMKICKRVFPWDVLGLDYLAAAAWRLGDFDQSWCYLRDALRIERHSWLPRTSARKLAFFARVLVVAGQPVRAVEVLTAALPPLAHSKFERTEAEELLADLKSRLSPDEFAAAQARGEAHDLETLTADVLEELERWEASPLPAGNWPPRPDQRLIDPLSDRELEVLRLVADGLSNREIAQELVVTLGTVKKHINNIFGKLQVRSRTQAVARATELNLLP